MQKQEKTTTLYTQTFETQEQLKRKTVKAAQKGIDRYSQKVTDQC